MRASHLLDTTPDAAARQRAAWRALSATDKLALVRDVSAMVLWLELEGLRHRRPTLAPEEIERAAIERRLGSVLAARAYARPPR
jgi:hypothetical protein